MLTAEQRTLRENHLTASVAKVVMSGDAVELLALYMELTGQAEPPDLSGVWAVQLGSYLETFILDWHANKTGHPLTERGRVVEHPTLKYVCATLDCYREFDGMTLDAKVVGGWQPLDTVIARYTPQAIVQLRCRQAKRCGLLIVHGSAEPREIEVVPNPDYEREMWDRVTAFWMCVESLTPPVPLPKVTPPSQWRTVDLNHDHRDNWGREMIAHLQQWATTRAAAIDNAAAADAAKKLVPEDVGLVTFSGISVNRDRRGYLSIRG